MFSRSFRIILLTVLAICAPRVAVSQKAPAVEITMARCWARPGDAVTRSVASDGETLFIASDNGRVEAVGKQDGKLVWSTELGGDVTSDLAVNGPRMFVITSRVSESGTSASVLRSLSAETGLTQWSSPVAAADSYYILAESDKTIVLAASGELFFYGIDGRLMTSRSTAGSLTAAPIFYTGKVVIAAGDTVKALSTATGEVLSSRKLPYKVTAIAKLTGDDLAAGDERGNVTILNGTEKPFWRFKSGGQISRVATLGTSVIATSHDNFIYRLAMRNGDVEWKRRLAGRIAELGFINSEQLITMSLDDQTAAITDLTTGRTAGQISFAEDEVLAARPITDDKRLYLATNRGLYSYSADGCDAKKEGGSGAVSPKPPL